MDQMLRKLDKFTARKVLMPESCGGDDCSFDFEDVVKDATAEIRGHFDGLCLDCMDASKPKHGDDDEDYWHHADRGVEWYSACRIGCGEPTWYYSFMGRKQKQVDWDMGKKRKRGDTENNPKCTRSEASPASV